LRRTDAQFILTRARSGRSRAWSNTTPVLFLGVLLTVIVQHYWCNILQVLRDCVQDDQCPLSVDTDPCQSRLGHRLCRIGSIGPECPPLCIESDSCLGRTVIVGPKYPHSVSTLTPVHPDTCTRCLQWSVSKNCYIRPEPCHMLRVDQARARTPPLLCPARSVRTPHLSQHRSLSLSTAPSVPPPPTPLSVPLNTALCLSQQPPLSLSTVLSSLSTVLSVPLNSVFRPQQRLLCPNSGRPRCHCR